METANQSLVFVVNGQRFELSQVDPSTTLLEFLRSQTSFTSVKLSCGEGCFFFASSLSLTSPFISEEVYHRIAVIVWSLGKKWITLFLVSCFQMNDLLFDFTFLMREISYYA